jgi:hypothetical protein
MKSYKGNLRRKEMLNFSIKCKPNGKWTTPSEKSFFKILFLEAQIAPTVSSVVGGQAEPRDDVQAKVLMDVLLVPAGETVAPLFEHVLQAWVAFGNLLLVPGNCPKPLITVNCDCIEAQISPGRL